MASVLEGTGLHRRFDLIVGSGKSFCIVSSEVSASKAENLIGSAYVVTWPNGQGTWEGVDFQPIAGHKGLLIPDATPYAREEMRSVASRLAKLGCELRITDTTDRPAGWTVADWNGSAEEFIAWAKAHTSDYRPPAPDAESPYDGLLPPVTAAPVAGLSTGPQDDAPPLEAYAADPPAHEPVSEPVAPKTRRKRSNRAVEGGNTASVPDPQADATQTANGRNILGEIFYRPMSEVQSRAINWLWPGRIAKGKVSMIVGNPGLGKSQVCASLASVVSNGGLWPVDRVKCALGSVVILSAEDDAEDTIRPRLEASNADLDKVFILDAIRTETETGEETRRGFDLTTDIVRLSVLLLEIGDVAMVIIDPITAYLGDADSHKNAEVRALLAPLAEMASTHRVAIIAVSHLTKSSGMDALLRVQGSIGFAAAARAVWGVAKDKDNPSRRLFMPLKNNLGTDTNGFAYSVESIKLQESDIETSHIMWENQLVTQTADEIFGNADLSNEEKGALFEAKVFLRDLLRDGPVDSKQIEIDARGAGHSMTTLRRAAKEMQLRIAKDGFGKGAPWKWWPQQQ